MKKPIYKIYREGNTGYFFLKRRNWLGCWVKYTETETDCGIYGEPYTFTVRFMTEKEALEHVATLLLQRRMDNHIKKHQKTMFIRDVYEDTVFKPQDK